MDFEVGPCLFRLLFSSPVSAVVWKNSYIENELVGGDDNLERGVRVVACCQKFYCLVNLIRYILDRQVWIV